MAAVSTEAIRKLHEFIESLPEEARSKCSLCNQTLTHIVKQAEAQTGAGTRTVTRMLAEKINEAAAPADQVTEDALRARVRETSGEKSYPVGPNRPNEPTAQNNTEKSCSSCSRRSRLDPGEVMREVESVIKEKGVTVNQAAKEVGVKLGRSANTVRGVYIKERDRTKARMGAGCADQFVRLAISQLERIDRDYHEGWMDAIERLEAWIRNFKGGAK